MFENCKTLESLLVSRHMFCDHAIVSGECKDVICEECAVEEAFEKRKAELEEAQA